MGSVLITGGAGFIGSHLVDALIEGGDRVTVLDDFSVGILENLADAEATGRLRIVTGSICDKAAVMDAMQDCDRVYHLAVQCVRRSIGEPRQSHDANATGTLVVLEAARQAAVQRFVYCSSSEVYGNSSAGLLQEDTTLCKPMTVYGASKLAGELYAEAYLRIYSLPTLVVRPFNAYGPRAYQTGVRAEVLPRFVARVLNGLPPVIFGDSSNGRDFTYVTEIAAGIAAAGKVDSLVGEKINLAYGRMVTVHEVATTVLKTLGRNDLAIEFADPRPGDVHRLRADTTKAEQRLGYEARVEFAQGVAKYVDWVRMRFPDPSALLDTKVVNWSMPAQRG